MPLHPPVIPGALRCALLAIFLGQLLPGCSSGGGDDSEPLVGGDTCTALTSGTWTFSGDAFGMGDTTMTGVLSLDATACTFALDTWDMQMDDLPSGGVLDADAVQLTGLTSFWQSCTGLASDETNASGTCSDNDTDWAMVLN